MRHKKRARPRRNPKTKKPVEIRAWRVVTFQASQLVKDKVLVEVRFAWQR
ncbi:MAG: HU family DNA-binding protein [Acidithiobacillus sp.]